MFGVSSVLASESGVEREFLEQMLFRSLLFDATLKNPTCLRSLYLTASEAIKYV